MAMIRPETEMKDSGVQWLGIIPKEWSVGKVKHEFYATKTIVGDKVNDYERLALTLNGVIKRSKDAGDGLQPEKFDGYQILKEHELVFKLIDLANVSTSRVGLSPYTGIVSPAYIVLHHRKDMNPRYGEYYFLSMWMNEVFNHIGGDGVRSALNAKDLLNIPYLKVSPDEQRAIADYLDKTCSQIDYIIAEAKASIDEYKELRQGVIFEAVTKGLDKNVEMKSTSVGWIGTVPSHWRLTKIRQVAEFYNGDRSSKYPSGDDIVSEGIIFITSNNLGYIVLNTNISTNKFITKQKYDDLGGAKLRKNDIVFCLRGSVGKCAINKAFDEGTIASSLVVIRAKKVDADYLNYVLQNHRITDEAIVNAIGIGSLNLAAHDISEFYMPIPPEKEMQDIVRYLNDKIGNVDYLIAEKESLINDLEAYKKSLIYEVVTGKRRVV